MFTSLVRFSLKKVLPFLPLLMLLSLVLLSLAGGRGAWAQFASSTLSGTAGSTINGTSLTAGGTWVQGQHQNNDVVFTAGGRARLTSGGSNWTVYTPSSSAPTSAYTVQADFYMANTPAAGDQFGVINRADGTVSGGYFAEVVQISSTWQVALGKGFNSYVSQAVFTPLSGETYRFFETAQPNAGTPSSTDISLKIQRLSDNEYATSAGGWQALATNAVSYTDSSPMAGPGKAGFWLFGTGPPTDSAGEHIANFSAYSSAVATMTATPGSVVASSTGNVISLVGSGTGWTSGTTFSVSGATKTAQSWTDATHASVTITAGSAVAASNITVSDSADSATTTLSTTTAPTNATAYTASGSPASPVTTGSPITITYSLTGGTLLPSSLVITPSASLGGTFSSGTLTYSGGTATMPNGTTSGTITFTPSAAGSLSLSQTHTGGGFSGDPSALAYTVNSGPFTIPVNSSAVRFSPGNWSGDTGRGGSVYRQSWTNGAWQTWVWTAGSSPSCTLQISNQTSGSQISYSLDGVLTKQVSVPASGGIAITVTPGSHTLTVYNDASAQSARWGLTNSYKATGLTVDSGASPGTAPSAQPWVLLIGDSITEGINALQGVPDFLSDYSYFTGQALEGQGYDFCVSACGYEGWISPGDSGGDVPSYYYISGSSGGAGGTYNDSLSRWNKLDASNSLLDSNSHISAYGGTGQEPALIYVNLGVNEALGAKSTSDEQASITSALTALRGAAPNAWILLQVPPNLYSTVIYGSTTGYTYITPVKAGVAAYQAAHPTDTKMVLVDFGQIGGNTLASFTNNVHPDIFGHAYLAPRVTAAILSKLSAATGGGKRRLQ